MSNNNRRDIPRNCTQPLEISAKYNNYLNILQLELTAKCQYVQLTYT